MASSMEWRGLKELQEELRRLPEDCHMEAAKVVEAHVNAAYVTIARVYGRHVFTGTLLRRLTLSPLRVSGGMITGVVLRSGSPLASLFDRGTQVRHYITVNGKKHLTGRMPATHIFSRTVGFTKRRILEDLKNMLIRRGAVKVTGE